MPRYTNGQSVQYKPVGGTSEIISFETQGTQKRWANRLLTPGPESRTSVSTGTIKSVLTEPGNQADRYVDASEGNPRYEVCIYC